MVSRQFGYLDQRDRARQAAVFVNLYRRAPSGDWREAFARWAGSQGKDFHPGDGHAIEVIVEEMMFASGDTVATDPLFTPEAA